MDPPTMGKSAFICAYEKLSADDYHYAGFPDGIPEGTPFGSPAISER